MLNREKVRLMTDLAIYEKNNKNTVFEVNNYYLFDYIIGQVFSSFIRYSLCFLLLFFIYLAVSADEFFYNINLNGIMETLTGVGHIYAAGLAVYLAITVLIYAMRYKKAQSGARLYVTRLKRLGRKYYYKKSGET